MWGKYCKLEERKIGHEIPSLHNKSIHKIKKMQFQYPLFGRKGVEISKK
jgi:hypothetical protein